MSDDLKKKKQDGKRISLTQKHEVAYLKKIAKEMLSKLQTDAKYCRKKKWLPQMFLFNEKGYMEDVRTNKLIRICKALLLALKRLR